MAAEKTKAATGKKPIAKQNTSRSAAALIAVLLVNFVRRRYGLTLEPELETIVNEELVPAIAGGLGLLTIYFRQKVDKVKKADE